VLNDGHGVHVTVVTWAVQGEFDLMEALVASALLVISIISMQKCQLF
jgi:hypothetical protein